MLEVILYFSAFNAFLMKILSKGGLIYKDARYFKEWFLGFFKYPPQRLVKFTKCVPCRMTILLGLPQTAVMFLIYGDCWQIPLAPFLIGVLSSFMYVVINPNHEEN